MDQITPQRQRRPELEQAFAHLAGLAASADLSGISDPLLQFVAVIRALMPRYGDVGAAPALDGVEVVPVDAGGVPAEWVMAPGADLAHRLVYIHGGGWVGGCPRDYRAMAGTLARLSGAAVLMVDYRLAPEHRFPAGLDDCVTAFGWASLRGPDAHRQSRKKPQGHLSLIGDSAGGNLAAATCLELVAKGARVPDRLVLIAGTLDNQSPVDRAGIDDQVATVESLATATAAYLGPGGDPSDYRVSPVRGPQALLAGFPPTLLQVSAIETLAYDSRNFAARLADAGVRVNLSIWPELPHVWHAFLGLFPEAIQALQEIAAFVNGGIDR
ncbi:alpha/beta hydrolase [Bradyrhizobium sp. CER78]|uniref:alpha/beta hydrolase n=1 Tax=Bradyrhizobium sp. CER78 TaxID=3039162 RepID=UPI00244C2768|nr:alpha/beta hydrolase [Bradyrhizobium sp. CER78]MDH2384311.1 alpha/beta hydrolase [Bradyrhizobium sp. CER78]